MDTQSLIFFQLGFLIVILPIALILILIYFSKLIKKLRSYQGDLERSKNQINKDKLSILDQAKSEAVRIIDEANSKALDIVQKSNFFVSSSHDNFDHQLTNVTNSQLKAFERATGEFIQLYTNVLNDLKLKNVEIFQTVSQKIEDSTLEEVNKFKETIEGEAIASQKILKQKIDHEYELAKKDIDIYKQNELKMVEDNIYEILEKISAAVLGKAIKPTEHEELILKALDKAKSEGIFKDAK